MTTTTGVDAQTILNNYIASQKAAGNTSTSSSTTSSSTQTSISKVTGDFNTFLNILTTQLKNQDPTQPMDASTFTQQLVQFSGIEQQINTNSKLDQVISSLNSNGITPLMNYVGTCVEASTTDTLVVQGGSAKLAYTLPSEAQSVKIYVKDSAGKTIATMDGATTKALNRVAWDGSKDAGGKVTDGTYTFQIIAKDSSGKEIKVEDKRVIGYVTGIETADGATNLKIGSMAIKDTNVLSVFATVTSNSSDESSSST